jgi:AcrR family transcriptional regulator
MEERRSRREERKEETRQELVAAAVDVFAEEGFHRASLDQIARRAGYSTGAIYWHFGGKDDLFMAAFDAFAVTRVNELTATRSEGEGELPARFRLFADRWMARQAADPRFLVVALEFLVHSWRDPELRQAFATRAAAVRLALGRIVEEEARAAGASLPMPAQDVATVMRELGVGLAVAKLGDPDAFPDELFGDFVQTFFELALARSPDTAEEPA